MLSGKFLSEEKMRFPNKIKLPLQQTTLINLFLMLILTSCNGYYTSWEKNKEINGIRFQKIRYGIRDGDTLAIIGYLKTNMKIDGYPCSADWIHFTKDWDLKLFRLSDTAMVNNYKYPKDAWIRFADDGTVICVFPEATRVQEFLCKGGGGAKGIQTAFYKSGRLRSFFADEDIWIQGIKCKSGVFNIIGLHENGNLKACTLSQATAINGIQYKKNAKLFFHEDGRVKMENKKN